MNYASYLLTPHWKALRAHKMKVGRYRCEKCGGSDALQCHHLRYRDWFDVTVSDLQLLCGHCHKVAHGHAAPHGVDDSPAMASFRRWLAKAPASGKKGKRNWAVKMARRELVDSGTLTTDAEKVFEGLRIGRKRRQ